MHSFRTLVKIVDAEYIGNDEIRTHDLTFELYNKTLLKTIILCLHNLENLTRKDNLHTKYVVPIVIKDITPSRLVSKYKEITEINEKHTLVQNPL